MSPSAAARALVLVLVSMLAAGCQSFGAQSQPDIQADHQMSGALTESPHMTLTPMRRGEGQVPAPHLCWMVHANVLDGDDPATVWGMSHDGMSHDHGHES